MLSEEKYPEGVFRQRRNFLLVSTLFAAFLFLDIEFSEIQIIGIKFVLRSKENLIWIVFAWWTYLFWRFYQYHREVRDAGLAQEYSHVVYNIATLIVQRHARKTFPGIINDHDVNYHALKPITRWRSNFSAKLIFPIGSTEGEVQYVHKEVTFEISRLWFIHAHVLAFLRVLFSNHRASDYLMPYAIAIFLATIFVSKTFLGT